MTSAIVLGQHLTLTIDSLAYGNGAGVARYEGLVIFVDGAAPGDALTVEITKIKKNFAEAKILNIDSPSPQRVSPACPVADNCGGCSWQHVDYAEQLTQKNNIVAKTFGALVASLESIHPIVAAPNPLFYRNRIQLHKKDDHWGFLKKKSSQLVSIEKCFIAESAINEYMNHLKTDESLPDTCRVELTLAPTGEVHHSLAKSDRDEIGFSQVNSPVNELLSAHILKLTSQLKPNVIHDLYAGNGNFTFPLAKQHPDQLVRSVELNSKAHKDAVSRQKDLNTNNVELIQNNVEDYLKKTSLDPDDFILVDPPRAGLQEKVLQRIADANCQAIIYVSCDPMTLKRDLTSLIKNSNLDIFSIQPFDMFPQTPHMELAAYLQRR